MTDVSGTIVERALLEDLCQVLQHWAPLGAPLHDESVRLFERDRILERPVRSRGTEHLAALLVDIDARTLLCRRLRERRPLVADIGHGSVANLSPELQGVLQGFGLDGDARTAMELIRALPGWVESEVAASAHAEHGTPTDVLLALLRDAFLVAELAWALGSSASAARDRDVVAAAVEAASTIAGVLLHCMARGPAAVLESGYVDEGLLIRMHFARVEWIGILLRFDEYADLVADGGFRLNVRLARLVGRQPDRPRGLRFLHLFVADPLPLVGPSIHVLARSATEEREKERLTRLAERIGEEERARFLDIAARLLLPRYLINHAVGMLKTLQSTDPERPEPVAASREGRLRKLARDTFWPLVLAASSGLLMFLLALSLFTLGLFERVSGGVPIGAVADESAMSTMLTGLRFLFPVIGLLWLANVFMVLRRRQRAASYALLLRVPAATGFGLAILLALSFEWIDTQAGIGRSGPIVAIFAAASYAWIEFINQGGAGQIASREGRLAGRPYLDLPLIALGIATSVSALVLEIFGRALLTRVDGYATLRENPLVYLETLALLSSVSLAIGTFLQAIWDEQAITAPLSYLRLRG